MNKLAFPVGFILGAFSWGIVSLVSTSFEPFDSSLGFGIGQTFLCCASLFVGYTGGFKSLGLFILAAYLGMNGYAYLFGGGDQRGYFLLGLLSSSILLVFPLIAGLLGRIAKYITVRITTKQGMTG